ncbi:hypothetical protein BGZ52_012184, partial [Haplosporangium bisporale]
SFTCGYLLLSSHYRRCIWRTPCLRDCSLAWCRRIECLAVDLYPRGTPNHYHVLDHISRLAQLPRHGQLFDQGGKRTQPSTTVDRCRTSDRDNVFVGG